jgi:uncharacterized protein (DUF488 family)
VQRDRNMIYTIGHSTHTLETFVEMCNAHGVRGVIDVRRFPMSRRHPHFSRESLAAELAKRGIEYTWLPDLGGRRAARPDSRNTRWRNASFRGYADYMETPPFLEAVARLQAIAVLRTSAIMCAEALWWRCHRSLIADYMTARGADVRHIVDARKVESHRYSEAARIVDGRLSYAEERLI